MKLAKCQTRTIGGFAFPAHGCSRETAEAWQLTRRYVALARDVLCVAQTRIEGAWCAYIAPVPGRCHADEAKYVADYGTKLQHDVAQVIFPEFANIPYHE